MSQAPRRVSKEEMNAEEAIFTASSVKEDVDAIDNKSSSSSLAEEKDASPSEGKTAAGFVPKLLVEGEDQTWRVDAQAGAAGATWKHRIPALLMILFFTRKFQLTSLFTCGRHTIRADILSLHRCR